MSGALDLHLTDEQRDLYEHARELGATVLNATAEAGEPGRVNRPLVAALAEHGLLGRMFADGREVRAIELCLIREALARGSAEAETAFALQGLGAYPILQAGTDAIKARWIPAVADGTAIAAFALTEPEAGSDVGALSLSAERDGQGYRLSGEKLWISNAPEADVYSVFARTGEGRRGITAFAVPGDAPGLSGERKHMLAPHSIGSLSFERVPVSDEDVLGQPGEGFRVAMRTLDLFRPSVGAYAIGTARRALDLAVDYALERHTFGKPLSDHQAVAHRLADVSARTNAARLLVHQAALAHDYGAPDPALAAMAKLLATETAQEAVDAAIQFHGARALEHGHPLEHLYREVRAPRIYEGASEIQREIIARGLFRAAAQRRTTVR
ncbi:MAG: acyl-CoA dehydrogenase family protein [Solirubrobacterales bacterium]|nr:acyl-CoA dehydrogenase family protein [Solirubrobacterales bacterium]